MAKVNLTAAAVARYRPGTRRLEIPDAGAPGLRLVVQPSGAKSWAMRFRRPDGRAAKLTLGPVDLTGEETPEEPTLGAPLTLAAARALAGQVHRLRAMGRDPQAERERQRDSASRNYGAAARRYVEEYARRNQARWRETAVCLGFRVGEGDGLTVAPGGLVARWGDRPLTEIDADALHRVVGECQRKGIPGAVRRKRGTVESRGRTLYLALSGFFNWAVRQRLLGASPVAGVVPPGQAPARERCLSDDEIRWFWAATGAAGQPFGPLFRLLLILGQREGEVAGMTRAELSPDGETWNLSGERTKNGRPHAVPLPPLAREILGDVRRIAGRAGYVFTTTGRTPVSGFSKAKRRLDEKMLEIARREAADAGHSPDETTIPPWRLHDLRRTAVTGMVELGVDPHVVEAVVNHVSGSRAGVAGVYNRAHLSAPKRAALERWAAHVGGLVAGRSATVLPMRA